MCVHRYSCLLEPEDQTCVAADFCHLKNPNQSPSETFNVNRRTLPPTSTATTRDEEPSRDPPATMRVKWQ